ncbi:hypothetical protein YC2023_086553 [Brassica napus]
MVNWIFWDKITCQPTDCFKRKHSISRSSNQHIFKARDPSSEERAECLSDESKQKIDIHIRWSSRKRTKIVIYGSLSSDDS